MYDIGATTSYVFKPFIVWYFIEYSGASMAYKINKKSHSITVLKISRSNLEAGVLYVTVLYLVPHVYYFRATYPCAAIVRATNIWALSSSLQCVCRVCQACWKTHNLAVFNERKTPNYKPLFRKLQLTTTSVSSSTFELL